MSMSFSITDETETGFLGDYGPDWSNRGSGDGKAGVAKTPYSAGPPDKVIGAANS